MKKTTRTESWTAEARRPSPFFVWLILLLGLLVAAAGIAGIWVAGKFAFGQYATGKVVEFHHAGSHSASIVGQVEVAVPDGASFRTEVDDAMGSQDWEVGADVSLRCTHFSSEEWSCSADSGIWRFVFPLLFLGAGAGMAWWSVRRVRSRSR